MRFIDYQLIIQLAWNAFQPKKRLSSIEDISAKVSTNQVFKLSFETRRFVIAKVSLFGRHEYFKEDHTIINTLANNLGFPFDQFIARSLLKGNEVFTYLYDEAGVRLWVVFYNPIRVQERLPKIISEAQIEISAYDLAQFHLACDEIVDEMPKSTKSTTTDLEDFQQWLSTDIGRFEYRQLGSEVRKQIDTYIQSAEYLHYKSFPDLPIFVDWNTGNFSVDTEGHFFSRWDYDWFRMSSRVLDFYFWARVVRSEGDQSVFSYTVDPLNEDRFLRFLRVYHSEFPLSEYEIRYIKEAYRFFILHYALHLGSVFFLGPFAAKLQREAFELYFPSIDTIRIDKLLTIL